MTLLLLLLACDTKLASLDEPKTTWTHVRELCGGGSRFGGYCEKGVLEVEGYPSHRTECKGGKVALQGGEDWLAYSCDDEVYPVYLGPSRLMEACGDTVPPPPLSERWLQVLACDYNHPGDVLHQAEEAGVVDQLMLGSIDLEMPMRAVTMAALEKEGPWIKAFHALPPEKKTELEPHLEKAFTQPTSTARIHRAMTLLDAGEADPELLLQRARELLPQSGDARDHALVLLLGATRGVEGNPEVACASVRDPLSYLDGPVLWILTEARAPCTVPELEPCSIAFGCEGALCTAEQSHERAVQVMDGEREGSLTESWFAYSTVMGTLSPELLLRNERLFYARLPESPRCTEVETPNQSCDCLSGWGGATAICKLEGTEKDFLTCRVVVDDAAKTITGWHVCTPQGESTLGSSDASCCEGLHKKGSTCSATVETFVSHLDRLQSGGPPDPEALQALKAQATVPEDLEALLALHDGGQAGALRLYGAAEVLAASAPYLQEGAAPGGFYESGAGTLVIGEHEGAHLHYTERGVDRVPPTSNDGGGRRKLGTGLDEALMELGVW